MGKFMYEGADTIGALIFPFIGSRIASYSYAVVYRAVAYGRRVGPHGVGAAVGCLSLAGVDYIYIVDHAVAVEVVLREVHGGVQLLAGLQHHGRWIAVVAVADLGTVIGAFVLGGDWSIDIELGSELAGTVLDKEVTGRSDAAILVEAFLVEHVLVVLGRVLYGKGHVFILYQNNDALDIALGGEVLAPHQSHAFLRQCVVVAFRGTHHGTCGVGNGGAVGIHAEAFGFADACEGAHGGIHVH